MKGSDEEGKRGLTRATAMGRFFWLTSERVSTLSG